MNELQRILKTLREDAIRQDVGGRHDKARDSFPNNLRQVGTFAEFEDAIGEYYAFHFSACIAPGAAMVRHEATERAKEILADDYRERGENLNQAFSDAQKRGLRRIYDILADRLRREGENRFKKSVFDKMVPPDNYEMKVELIRQMFAAAPELFGDFDKHQPEKYHPEYSRLVSRLIDNLDRLARESRRV
jgi:hypothetical protein